MKTPVMILFAVLLAAGCSEDPARPEVPIVAPAPLTADQAVLWARSCGLCHADGTGGAPVLGNSEAWAGRVAKGKAVLMEHTLYGFNNMPPLGYCMACEEADYSAMIDFMAGRVVP